MIALSRNGIRHPQLRKAPSRSGLELSWFMNNVMIRNSPLAMKKPMGAPSCGHIAAQARLPSLAVSVASSAAPDHSPPSPRPWQKRMSANNAGASSPIW